MKNDSEEADKRNRAMERENFLERIRFLEQQLAQYKEKNLEQSKIIEELAGIKTSALLAKKTKK